MTGRLCRTPDRPRRVQHKGAKPVGFVSACENDAERIAQIRRHGQVSLPLAFTGDFRRPHERPIEPTPGTGTGDLANRRRSEHGTGIVYGAPGSTPMPVPARIGDRHRLPRRDARTHACPRFCLPQHRCPSQVNVPGELCRHVSAPVLHLWSARPDPRPAISCRELDTRIESRYMAPDRSNVSKLLPQGGTCRIR